MSRPIHRVKKSRPAPRPPRPEDSTAPAASPAQAAGPNRLLIALFFFLLAVPLYGDTLGHRYALDDAIVITQNSYTKRGVAGIPDIFAHDSFAGFPMVRKDLVSGGRYRPLSIATFALEYQAAGPSPGLSHLVNLLLYGLTGALLYLLLLRLFQAERRTPWWMAPAFLITLLYVTHPLHTEIVANIKGRDEILAFLFALGTFHACLSYYENPGGRGSLHLAAAGFLLLLGALAKESVLPFVAIIPLGLWFFRGSHPRRLGFVLGALMLPVVVYAVARSVFAGPMAVVHTPDLLNDPFAYATFSQRLATVFETFGVYLRLFLLPHPLTHDYYYNQVPLTDLGHLSSFLPAVIALALAGVTAVGTPRRSPIAFGLLYFALGFSIVSNLFFSIGTTMAERFLYIPSLGLAIALVFTLDGLSRQALGGQGRRAAAILLIFLSVAYSAKTIVRNLAWKDNLTLFTTDLATSSRSAKEQGDMASVLAEKAAGEKDPSVRRDLMDRAVQHYRKAIEIYPEHSLAWFGLGNVLTKQGKDKLPEAIECYRHVVTLEPRKAVAYLDLALAADQLGDHATALSSVRSYRSLAPEDSAAALLEAMYLERSGQVDAAMAACDALTRSQPRNAAAWGESGRLAAQYRHDYAKAVDHLSRALALDSTNVSYYENLGSVQIMLGQSGAAAETLERGLARCGETYLLDMNLAEASRRMGDREKWARYAARGRRLQGGSR